MYTDAWANWWMMSTIMSGSVDCWSLNIDQEFSFLETLIPSMAIFIFLPSSYGGHIGECIQFEFISWVRVFQIIPLGKQKMNITFCIRIYCGNWKIIPEFLVRRMQCSVLEISYPEISNSMRDMAGTTVNNEIVYRVPLLIVIRLAMVLLVTLRQPLLDWAGTLLLDLTSKTSFAFFR